MSKQGSERLKSRTEIQVGEEELQNQRTRFVARTAASSKHHAEVRVRGKQVEEMHRKDIRNSEVKSQKQKRSQYQKVWTRR